MYDDPVFKSVIHLDESTEKMTHVLTQPTEDIILERNKGLRNNPGVIRDLGAQSEEGTWGRMVASIPMGLMLWASRNGYDIYNRDSEIASKELFRFLQSEKGKPCLVRDRI